MNGRFSNQIRLPEVGISGQEAIKNSKVLIVGLGGLGCPSAQYLAAAGIGQIGLVDPDLVEESNLHRQILYTLKDLGKPKVEVAALALKSISPSSNILCYNETLNLSNADKILNNYDIVVDCTDNFEAKFLLNDLCLEKKKTLISASATGFEANLMVVKNDGPCLRCVYPHALSADIGNCSLTGILGPFLGIVGSWQAAETLKVILGGKDFKSPVLFFDFYLSKVRSVTLEKNPICFCVHQQKPQESDLFIRMDQVEKLIDYTLIDVRSDDERESDPFPFKSTHIPHLDIISEEFDSKVWGRENNYVFYCSKGQRSVTVAQWLRKNGVANAFSLGR